MGDLTRACMNRSMHTGSPRKDNAEEVAKRRAAMQRELELRREETRRLQEEKMARAAAQKEERLQKQRELQQKEAQRMQAALQRRNAALAEEKLKKAAAIAKAEQAAPRHAMQQKTRSLYAFGSSTPRELGYLTQLSKQQQVYDRKLQPSSGGISSPALNSSRRLSSTSRVVQMTRSMYLPSSDSARRISGRSIPSVMSRSVYSPQNISRNSPLLNATPRRTLSKDVIKQHKYGNANFVGQHHSEDRPISNTKATRTAQLKRHKEKVPNSEGEKCKVFKRENISKHSPSAHRSSEKADNITENSSLSGAVEVKKLKPVVHPLNLSAAGAEEPATVHSVEAGTGVLKKRENKDENASIVSNVPSIPKVFNNVAHEQMFGTTEEYMHEKQVVPKVPVSNSMAVDQENEPFDRDANSMMTSESEDHEYKSLEPEMKRERSNTITKTTCAELLTDSQAVSADIEISASETEVQVESGNVNSTALVNQIETSSEKPSVAKTTESDNDATAEGAYTVQNVVNANINTSKDGYKDAGMVPLGTQPSANINVAAVTAERTFDAAESLSYVSTEVAPIKAQQQPQTGTEYSTNTSEDTARTLPLESVQASVTHDSDVDVMSDTNTRSIESDHGEEQIAATDSCVLKDTGGVNLGVASNHERSDANSNSLNVEYVAANNALSDNLANLVSDGNGNIERTSSNSIDDVAAKDGHVSTNSDQLKNDNKVVMEQKQQEEGRESTEVSKYVEAQREREERRARLAAIMSRTRGTPTAVVAPNTQRAKDAGDNNTLLSKSGAVKDDGNATVDIKDMHRFASEKTASILQRLASSKPQLISSNPHLMSLLQRNGSSQSLADELSAADRRSPPSSTTPSAAYEHSKEASLTVVNSNTFNSEAEKQQSVAT